MTEELKSGDVLSESYQLVEIIGQGGMGQVWRAQHMRLPKQVAGDQTGGQSPPAPRAKPDGAPPTLRAPSARGAGGARAMGHPRGSGVTHDR